MPRARALMEAGSGGDAPGASGGTGLERRATKAASTPPVTSDVVGDLCEDRTAAAPDKDVSKSTESVLVPDVVG